MKVSTKTIDICIEEAERFIVRAKAWKERLSGKDGYDVLFGSKEGGACKRSSLDLTMVLVELRKGNFKMK